MDDLRTLWEKYSDLDVESKFASISGYMEIRPN